MPELYRFCMNEYSISMADKLNIKQIDELYLGFTIDLKSVIIFFSDINSLNIISHYGIFNLSIHGFTYVRWLKENKKKYNELVSLILDRLPFVNKIFNMDNCQKVEMKINNKDIYIPNDWNINKDAFISLNSEKNFSKTLIEILENKFYYNLCNNFADLKGIFLPIFKHNQKHPRKIVEGNISPLLCDDNHAQKLLIKGTKYPGKNMIFSYDEESKLFICFKNTKDNVWHAFHLLPENCSDVYKTYIYKIFKKRI